MLRRLLYGLFLLILSTIPFVSVGGDIRCGAFDVDKGNPAYVDGFYPGWMFDPGNASPNDQSKWCSVNGTYFYNEDTLAGPSLGQAGGTWTRKCRTALQVNAPTFSCNAKVLPLEDPGCGSIKPYTKKPVNNLLNPLCIKADDHGLVSPGTPTVGNIGGGAGVPWSWTCGGTYYNTKTCEAPSQAVCGSTYENGQFNELLLADDLCENGKPTQPVLDPATFIRSRTCNGSAEDYNVQCNATKPAVLPECNFVYNNKQFDTFEQFDDLCTRGSMTGFVEKEDNSGRAWTCAGEPATKTLACVANRKVLPGICAAGSANYKVPLNVQNEEDFLKAYTAGQLCQQGSPTTIVNNGSTWSRTCTGTRTQDNKKCTSAEQNIVGACSSSDGLTFVNLKATDNLCANSLPATSFAYNDATFSWTWKCPGTTSSATCSAQKQAGGVCATVLEKKIITYDTLQSNLSALCKVGEPDVTSFSQDPDKGQRKRNCLGVNKGSTTACVSYKKVDAVCQTFSAPATVTPSPLCVAGDGTNLSMLQTKRIRQCKGRNGGAAVSCETACANSQCIANNCDGSPSIVNNGETCNDCDGCSCGGTRIFNGVQCVANGSCTAGQTCEFEGGCTLQGYTFSKGQTCNVPDKQCTTISDGQMCTDPDCCLCGDIKIGTNVLCALNDGVPGICTDKQMCTDADGCQLGSFFFTPGEMCLGTDGKPGTCKETEICSDPDACIFGKYKVAYGLVCTTLQNPTPVEEGKDCIDDGGCICGDYQIYKGQTCSLTDGNVSQIEGGDICGDLDGCLCGPYQIYVSKLCDILDGSPGTVETGKACDDIDGCICGDTKIKKGAICTPSDGEPTTLTDGQVCNDPDGCLCNGLLITQGSTCTKSIGNIGSGTQIDPTSWDYVLPMFRTPFGPGSESFGFGSLYDPSMMLPGDADLAVEHVADTQTGSRGTWSSFTVRYKNNGPDVAVGSYIAYKKSSLLGEISGSRPHTILADPDGSGKVDDSIVYFYVGHILPGQTGEIHISGYVKKTLSGDFVMNTAQIQSRLRDSNPLNNTKSVSMELDKTLYSGKDIGGTYLVNPLLSLKVALDKYSGIIDRVGARTDFRDIITGYPWYMHIMTVQRNGIMKGYEYQYSTVFSPKKCISRLEYIAVMARIMHMRSDSDVMDSPYTTTPYKDVPYNETLSKYVNRAHKKGLTDIFKAGESQPDILKKDTPVTHKQAKEILFRLYVLMQADTTVLKPLLVGNESDQKNECLTRGEAAYTIAHILRGNSQIVMGFNDIFLAKLYKVLQKLSIVERREAISRLMYRLKLMSPSMLFRLGLDQETLLGVLDASMKGNEYLPRMENASSAQNFFYQIAEDEYDKYINSLYGK